MAAGVTTTADVQLEARKRDFVSSFASNWNALLEVLGITRPIKKTPGTTLTSYRASVELESGDVDEGDPIPLSKANITEVAHKPLKIKKHGKAVSIELVDKYGADLAIEMTDEEFKNEIQGVILEDFYTELQKGELTATAESFQLGMAIALGKVKDKFKKMRKDSSRVVVWVNTMDAYQYLGVSNISVQTLNGLEYIKNFMGAETLILSSDIPEGKIIACPTNNMVNYYLDPSDPAYQKMGLNYYVDGETNFVGFAIEGNYSNATGTTWALYGNVLWPEYVDAIAVVTVGENGAGGGNGTGGGNDEGGEDAGGEDAGGEE